MRLFLSAILLSTSLQAKAFIAHEWGTFTSFQDAQGNALLGLHRGDQPLPDFVYLRNPLTPQSQSHSIEGCFANSYSCDYDPDHSGPISHLSNLINQRMETPVIYFYSDENMKAQVKVDFPKGIITEWFPKATEFVPAIGEVFGIRDGSMTWDIDISTNTLSVPPVSEHSIWHPSRQVDANFISAGNENERLIFYRGVGYFETPFRAKRNDLSFTLHNLSENHKSEVIPSVLYIRVQNGRGYVETLGSLGAEREYTVPEENVSYHMDDYLAEATSQLVRQLVLAGLYEKEALAMANTWRQAYFLTPGERFLYILPRPWTEDLLPLTITPAPQELSRVLVGRVEVMNTVRFNHAYATIKQLALSDTPTEIINLNFSGFEEQVLRMAQDSAVTSETDEGIQMKIRDFCQMMIQKFYRPH